MKILYSFWQSRNHVFCNLEMAKLSHHCVKKLGYNTCLYTDKTGYGMLKNIINYDEIVIFDDQLLSKFSSQIWSLGKILAMSLVESPFIHIDFDVFLLKPFESSLLNKDFFATYEEPWIHNFQTNISKIYELYPHQKELDINNFTSFNFSIIGGQNFKKINEVCKKIIDFAIDYKEDVEKIKTNLTWEHAVTFEQIMIPNMLLTLCNIQTETIFPKINKQDLEGKNFEIQIKKYMIENFINNKIIHLHGDKLNKLKLIENYLI